MTSWSDGTLELSAQDLAPPGALGLSEYEYGFVIEAPDVPRLVEQLGAESGSDPGDVLVAHADRLIDHGAGVDRLRRGDAGIGPGGWLDAHDVPHRFWSHSSVDWEALE